jgi:hypothetical protein
MSLTDCVVAVTVIMLMLGACGLFATRKGRVGSSR